MNWVEESNSKPSGSKKRKRRVGKRILEFNEWGSTPLLVFLEAIGKDTTVKYSQRDVATFVTKYINDNGLSCPTKKKKVICDEILFDLFGKKTLPRTKIFDSLEEHFAENYDSSDDEDLDSSDEECSKKKKSNTASLIKKVPPKSCFAAVIAENIKLVYLKKTLIQEFLKVPESFEDKIIGSFVRMKSDRYDIYQKNRFNLQLVTGVEKSTEAGGEVRLKLANYFKDVPVSELSDDNFAKEEIEDLQDRIKAGSLRRLTVVNILTIDEFIASLLISAFTLEDFTLFEYLDRRKILQTPSEVEKLLLKIPEVIAEELEPEVIVDEKAEGNDFSPISILRGNSDVSNASGYGDLVTPSQAIINDSHAPGGQNGHEDGYETSIQMEEMEDQPADLIQQGALIINVIDDDCNIETQAVITEEKYSQVKQEQPLATTQVIELSDDDENGDESTDFGPTGMDRESPDDVIWHYLDPQGNTQGPFSLNSLKRWYDADYFNSGFKVWKLGQSPDDSVILADILNRIFSC
ncbi:hypothetical protein RD792_004407 [Penstemon davidsonii]|uniref:Uncharacterized protein n=1 Tax=Penstemon davidsonii TaxID=160366 RepID=A0ABR0DII5_9LAMI|nr:hypothetical protein RD792_004407 [Penstemon davidsonii]